MNRLIITGATGYLGRNLIMNLRSSYKIAALVRHQSNIKALPNDIDLIRIDNAEWINKIESNDSVIHCATNYGKNLEDIETIENVNVGLPLKILKVLDSSSCFINIDTSLPKEISLYSKTKAQFRERSKEFITKVIHIQSEYFYGPNDVDWKFITMCIRKLQGKENLELSPCDQKRDFIYIKDAVEGIRIVLENQEKIESQKIIDLGSGVTIELKELVQLIASKIQGDHEINFGAYPRRLNEVMESKADITYMRSMGWEPRISLDTGLRLIIQEEAKRLDEKHKRTTTNSTS